MAVRDISSQGRDATGVRVMNLDERPDGRRGGPRARRRRGRRSAALDRSSGPRPSRRPARRDPRPEPGAPTSEEGRTAIGRSSRTRGRGDARARSASALGPAGGRPPPRWRCCCRRPGRTVVDRARARTAADAAALAGVAGGRAGGRAAGRRPTAASLEATRRVGTGRRGDGCGSARPGPRPGRHPATGRLDVARLRPPVGPARVPPPTRGYSSVG